MEEGLESSGLRVYLISRLMKCELFLKAIYLHDLQVVRMRNSICSCSDVTRAYLSMPMLSSHT